MTDPLAALRAAVLLHPADDVARSVYADACLESGDAAMMAHGELVLLQLARADEKRQRELLGEWLWEWLNGDRSPRSAKHLEGEWWSLTTDCRVAVRRGFVSAVHLRDPRDGPAYWTEQTPDRTADIYGTIVEALFAEQPLEVIYFEFGGSEAWRVASDAWPPPARWMCSDAYDAGRVFAAAPDRPTLGVRLMEAFRARIVEIGEQILRSRRGEWGAGIL